MSLTTGRQASVIPPSNFCASNPNGIDQVGWGRDLRWDPVTNDWIGDLSESYDSIVKRSGDHLIELVKRTYRVLRTRGLKGCYVYFADQTARVELDRLCVN
jgi:DUF2075 family protein